MMTFGFHQPVTLKSDPTFFGYFWAQVSDDSGIEHVMIAVKYPGKTKLHVNGNYAFPAADVEPTEDRKVRARKPPGSATPAMAMGAPQQETIS